MVNEIARDYYLEKLINAEQNGLIKVVTGMRRSGKTYLLFTIFKKRLLQDGCPQDHIIEVSLDQRENVGLRNPDALLKYIKSKIVDNNLYYILLDEIQMAEDFVDVLNSLLHISNADVYVTGSNSKFLSSDIVTEFRGRSDQIRVFPLSFSEFFSVYDGDRRDAWNEYWRFGGLPQVVRLKSESSKQEFLNSVFENTYQRDILERYNIRYKEELSEITEVIASSIGSLTSSRNLEKTFASKTNKKITHNTIDKYIGYLKDSFLIEEAVRYDIKGKRYINSPVKYYFTDLGVRNSVSGFRQMEESHIMENIIYNELKKLGYQVDVGSVGIREQNRNGNFVLKQTEVDFVVNKADRRYYIQSVLSLETREKTIQEERPFKNIDDNFSKIIITGGSGRPWHTEEGILIVGIIDFLLNPKLILNN